MEKYVNVTLDGPCGSGKTTIAKLLAKRLGYEYVDTGAMYRAVAYYVKNSGIDVTDENGVESVLGDITVQLKTINGVQRIFLNGEDISDSIRTPEISMSASTVSKIGAVRQKLVALQRELASMGNTIFDGRDMGSVVLPNADFKFFLTASTDTRAMRRYKELLEKGQDVQFENVKADMIARDAQDSSRALSPLVIPDGATVVDTSDMQIDEVLDFIYNKIVK